MAIAIRTAVIRDGIALVQAGGGVVADSVPSAEHQESVNKSRAVLRAVALAGALHEVRDGVPAAPAAGHTGGTRRR
jgi:anthranilate synthase component 1